MSKLISHLAVIGHKQRAACIVIQSSHRKESCIYILDHFHYSQTVFVVGNGSDHARRFVYQHIFKLCAVFKQPSVNLNLVAFCHIIAGLLHYRSVYLDIAVQNQVVSLAAACNSGLCYIFVYSHLYLPSFNLSEYIGHKPFLRTIAS